MGAPLSTDAGRTTEVNYLINNSLCGLCAGILPFGHVGFHNIIIKSHLFTLYFCFCCLKYRLLENLEKVTDVAHVTFLRHGSGPEGEKSHREVQ